MAAPLHLFDAFGIELEYMLVDSETLDITPAVDRIFHAATGRYASDHDEGDITWSNELVRHVLEVKVSHPVASLRDLENRFNQSIARVNAHAAAFNARLLPTAMHPWMDPRRETQLWPHEYAEVYESFHRVFDCYRHGWANLQSVHLNLPFHGDGEFARLHAAVRMVLPIIPAIAASSPVMDGRVTGILDNRLDVYCNNSRLISEIAGDIIPEPVYSESEYRQRIFEPMFRAIAPHDPDGNLQDEFLNARGAIARFDRGAIEIRLIDVQECPLADLAIVQAVVHAVRAMAEERDCRSEDQKVWSSERLRKILSRAIREGENTVIDDHDYLAMWGLHGRPACTAVDVWRHILRDTKWETKGLEAAFDVICTRGTLATRMLARMGHDPSNKDIRLLYGKLADCLMQGRLLT